MQVMLKNILVGSGWFALVGPPIGGAQMVLLLLLAGRHQITSVMDVLAVIGFSYFFGLIHAGGAGAVSGAIISRCHHARTFILLCLVAEAAIACLLLFPLGLDLFSYNGLGLAVLGVIPTTVCAALFWCWHRRKNSPDMHPSSSLVGRY